MGDFDAVREALHEERRTAIRPMTLIPNTKADRHNGADPGTFHDLRIELGNTSSVHTFNRTELQALHDALARYLDLIAHD